MITIWLQRFMLVTLFIVFLLRFLVADWGFLGRVLVLGIEFLCFSALILAVWGVSAGFKFRMPSKYGLLFVLFAVSVICSAFANQVQPGAVFSGIRNTFMYLPFFLLPLVFSFNERQFNCQLKLILSLALLQLPVSVYQWSLGAKGGTMDHVSGTLSISSFLSIFLICLVSVIWSMFLSGRIGIKTLVVLLLCLLAPTTLNETKGSLLLLPFAFLVPAFIFSLQNRTLKVFVYSFVMVVFVLGGFLLSFSIFLSDLNTANLAGFFTDGKFIDYLYSQADENAPRTYGVYTDVGRVDSIIFALKYISSDVVRFFFGYGIGNVSESYLTLTAGDFDKFAHLGPQISTLSYLLWEHGINGAIIVVVFCFFVLRDSFVLAGSSGGFSTFARGWAGVVVVLIFALPYKNLMISDVNGILFWYFSGFIVGGVARLGR